MQTAVLMVWRCGQVSLYTDYLYKQIHICCLHLLLLIPFANQLLQIDVNSLGTGAILYKSGSFYSIIVVINHISMYSQGLNLFFNNLSNFHSLQSLARSYRCKTSDIIRYTVKKLGAKCQRRRHPSPLRVKNHTMWFSKLFTNPVSQLKCSCLQTFLIFSNRWTFKWLHALYNTKKVLFFWGSLCGLWIKGE